ncbi:DNA damage-inducible protein 1 [Lecanora helva]
MTVEDLKSYIESETGVKSMDQRIIHNNQELADGSKTLQECHIIEDSMLGMLIRPKERRQGNAGPRRPAQGPPEDPETFRLQILGHPGGLAQLQARSPELANAVHDPERFRRTWEELKQRQANLEAERQRRQDMLAADPFDVDAQREIEEMIREEQVMENLQNAVEHNPEVFGRVHMLYIPVEVNQYKVKAFVDSGAQTTIMSPSCAEKCGILRLLDKRFAGVARGVGTAKILGRVHSAIIKIGNAFLPCSFTVMEGKDVDLLLGLDMLKKHQACIDLGKNRLIIQENEVAFLGEAEIPKGDEVYKEEPTIQGPDGTKTGAISGTVIPPNNTGASSSGSVSSSTATQGGPSGQAAATNNPQAQSTTGPASFPKESIERLMSMGFSREESIHALELAGGNVEMAAGFLL